MKQITKQKKNNLAQATPAKTKERNNKQINKPKKTKQKNTGGMV